MTQKSKIFIAGHRGMVGSAILRKLQARQDADIVVRTRQELDLTNQRAVRDFFTTEKPNQVYIAAAIVGGIHANNTLPANFIYENLMIQSNIIHEAFIGGVKKILFLGSSCIYPRMAIQPIHEDTSLTGPLEPTNEPYAIAKIAGIKLCESYNRQYGVSHGVDYRSVMPTNLYGPGDNYHPENSHVIPGLIRRFHEAKILNSPTVSVWGTGKVRREFLYVDDMASASIFLMNLDIKIYQKQTSPSVSHVNVGFGSDISIAELANAVADVVSYKGGIVFDSSRPDGPPRKLIDSTKINSLGWNPSMTLDEGLKLTYADFLRVMR